MCSVKILIVDDDIIICQLLTTYLSYHGFQPYSVNSGEDAISMLNKEHFHGVITDLKMGGVNGHDVILHAKKVAPDTVVIMITGCSKEEDKKIAYKNGVDAFVLKPFSAGDLIKSTSFAKLRAMLCEKHTRLPAK